MAVCKNNADAAATFEFLSRLVKILRRYLPNTTVMDENVIRGNFVVIYELLDEIMDFGYPQITDVDVLSTYILQAGAKPLSVKDAEQAIAKATGAVSWRDRNIHYKRNEVFLDVVEEVNLLMSAKGNVLRSDVSGKIMVRSKLSGMPECKLGLNDKLMLEQEAKTKRRKSSRTGVAIDDFAFHQCVRLGKFDTERAITFIPPDGEFELMSYRTTQGVNLPFRITPIIKEHSRTRVDVVVTVKALFSHKLFATKVVLKIPVPKNTATVKITVKSGKAKYVAEEGGIVWKLPKRFDGGDKEETLSASIDLIATLNELDKGWSRPPISMSFQVPMITASNLQVRFLKIYEKSDYRPVKWVRYITKAGTYETRT